MLVIDYLVSKRINPEMGGHFHTSNMKLLSLLFPKGKLFLQIADSSDIKERPSFDLLILEKMRSVLT